MPSDQYAPAINLLRSLGLSPTFTRLAVARSLLAEGPAVAIARIRERAADEDLPMCLEDVAAALSELRHGPLPRAAEARLDQSQSDFE